MSFDEANPLLDKVRMVFKIPKLERPSSLQQMSAPVNELFRKMPGYYKQLDGNTWDDRCHSGYYPGKVWKYQHIFWDICVNVIQFGASPPDNRHPYKVPACYRLEFLMSEDTPPVLVFELPRHPNLINLDFVCHPRWPSVYPVTCKLTGLPLQLRFGRDRRVCLRDWLLHDVDNDYKPAVTWYIRDAGCDDITSSAKIRQALRGQFINLAWPPSEWGQTGQMRSVLRPLHNYVRRSKFQTQVGSPDVYKYYFHVDGEVMFIWNTPVRNADLGSAGLVRFQYQGRNFWIQFADQPEVPHKPSRRDPITDLSTSEDEPSEVPAAGSDGSCFMDLVSSEEEP